jgi:hypothetical protein
MFFDDLNPPHFHASYGEEEALIETRTLAVFAGHLSPRVLDLDIEWAPLHQQELMDDWQRGQNKQSLLKIESLR